MRALTTIAKNLKLLSRSRETAYTILFGPLLIILIVSFAFIGSSDEYDISIGVAGNSPMMDATVATLNERSYRVSVYDTFDTCIDAVREGTAHACIAFGQTQAEQTPVTFYVDESRLNLVYKIVDDLSNVLDVQADTIRKRLAQGALVRMESAATVVEESAQRTDALLERFTIISQDLGTAREALGKIPSEPENVTDLRVIKGYQQGFAQHSQTIANEVLPVFDDALSAVRALEAKCVDCPEGLTNEVDRLEDSIEETRGMILQITEDEVPRRLEEAQLALTYAIEDVERIRSQIENATAAGATVTTSATSAFDAIDAGKVELASISSRLHYATDFLRGEETTAEMLTAPITTDVVSITVEDSTLSFAYPYLLVLIIMFMGLLLSSMLIVTDKTSRAAFRNFTTPTSDWYNVSMSFLTAFLILIVEVIVLLALSTIFVAQPIFLNFTTTLLLICVAIAIFTCLGMIIGYLSSTQEAAMITSISIGSVFLFVSNLIIPLEGMARLVQMVSAFNPYIVLSELVKRSMLYGVSSTQIFRQLLILFAFIFVLVIATLIVHQRLRQRYFRQEGLLTPAGKHVPTPLPLGEQLVHDEVELLDVLDTMPRATFEQLVTGNDNIISMWVEKELRNRRLARGLRTRSKERMLMKIDHYLRKHKKGMKE